VTDSEKRHPLNKLLLSYKGRLFPTPTFLWFLAGLLVVGVAFGVYANTLKNGFVWDDHILIADNPFVQDWNNVGEVLSWDYFFRTSPIKTENASRPVWILSALLDCKLWGLTPAGHHLTNVLLHALNSLLVFVLAAMFLMGKTDPESGGGRTRAPGFGPRPLAFSILAALLFAVHPIHTEPVAAVGFRADLLATLFFLAAFIFYKAFQSALEKTFGNGGTHKSPLIAPPALLKAWPWLALSVVAYGLGLLSKEMAVTLPFVLILHDFLLKTGAQWRPLLKKAPAYAGYFLLWPLYAVFHFRRFDYYFGDMAVKWVERLTSLLTFALPVRAESVVSPTPSMSALWAGDPVTNLFTMSTVFVSYLKLLVWPAGLRAEHMVTPLTQPTAAVVLSLALLGGLAAFAVAVHKKSPAVSFLILAFFVALLPVANLRPLYNVMAERYLYLPSVFFCLLAVYSVSMAFLRRPAFLEALPVSFLRAAPPVLTLALALVVLAVFSSITVERNGVWRDDATFWRTASLQSPQAARTWYNLGVLAQKRNDLEHAERYYRKALALRPDYVEPRTNLLAIVDIEKQGRPDGYESILAKQPRTYVPYLNAANALMKEKKYAEAAALYKKIQHGFPDTSYPWVDVFLNLAKAYALMGEPALSEATFDRCVGDRGKSARARRDLGKFYDDAGHYAEAEKHYQKALVFRPDWAAAEVDLGVVYHHQGRFPEALRMIQAGLRHAPDRAVAHYNLGIVYSDMSESALAEKSFREAIRLSKDYTDAHYNLAVVHQRQGKMTEAIAGYEKVTTLDPRRVEALSNLGGCYEQLGDLQKAEKYCRRAVQVDPTRSCPLVTLGNIYQKRGLFAEATGFYQNAIRIDPIDVMAYNNLGACYLRLGEAKKAEQEFASAIRLNPAFADAYYNLGLALERQGQRDRAVAAWKSALAADPTHTGARQALERIAG